MAGGGGRYLVNPWGILPCCVAASQIQQIQFLHSTFEMNTSATCITRVTSTSLFLSRYVQTYVYVRVCQKHTHTLL